MRMDKSGATICFDYFKALCPAEQPLLSSGFTRPDDDKTPTATETDQQREERLLNVFTYVEGKLLLLLFYLFIMIMYKHQ